LFDRKVRGRYRVRSKTKEKLGIVPCIQVQQFTGSYYIKFHPTLYKTIASFNPYTRPLESIPP